MSAEESHNNVLYQEQFGDFKNIYYIIYFFIYHTLQNSVFNKIKISFMTYIKANQL